MKPGWIVLVVLVLAAVVAAVGLVYERGKPQEGAPAAAQEDAEAEAPPVARVQVAPLR